MQNRLGPHLCEAGDAGSKKPDPVHSNLYVLQVFNIYCLTTNIYIVMGGRSLAPVWVSVCLLPSSGLHTGGEGTDWPLPTLASVSFAANI